MITVLIVDDDEDILQMLRDVLAPEGMRGIVVSEPGQAESAAHAVQADACIIDLMLQGRSGVEVAEDLREAGYRDVPLIGMSASHFLAEIARETGLFAGVLEKPFELDDLLLALSEAIPASKRERASTPLR